TGAINRFKVVITKYQTTRHVEEALMRLTESYMALGIVDEAQTAAAVLGHNFPDSQWYKHAYALVKTGGAEPKENQGSWISKPLKGMGGWRPADWIHSVGPAQGQALCRPSASLMMANLQDQFLCSLYRPFATYFL